MAWLKCARKLELQPESDAQPAIVPTQCIYHTMEADWSPDQLYQYWQTTNLESHFGVGRDGSAAQFIGTQTRADANYLANRRPDGTGAISVETTGFGSQPWSDAQIETLIKIGVEAHQLHNIPLRACRSADDPGYGFHRMHSAWSPSGTDCPGNQRVAQFTARVLPGIIAAAAAQEVPVPTTPPPAPTPTLEQRLAALEERVKVLEAKP